jgi:lysophospholipase L1-like esterase
VTAPLTTVQTGIKARIKEIIGKPVGGYKDNIKREQFNEKLRKVYEGNGPVFDLAAIESTYPDGTRAFFKAASGTYPFLVPEYTVDGGHLNAKGRKIVAEQLLIVLAKLNS